MLKKSLDYAKDEFNKVPNGDNEDQQYIKQIVTIDYNILRALKEFKERKERQEEIDNSISPEELVKQLKADMDRNSNIEEKKTDTPKTDSNNNSKDTELDEESEYLKNDNNLEYVVIDTKEER